MAKDRYQGNVAYPIVNQLSFHTNSNTLKTLSPLSCVLGVLIQSSVTNRGTSEQPNCIYVCLVVPIAAPFTSDQLMLSSSCSSMRPTVQTLSPRTR
jgi:hypothetical protein